MNEIYEKLAAAGQLATTAGGSALEFDSHARVCEVYELWVHKDSNTVTPLFRKLDSGLMPEWLRNGPSSEAKPLHALALRLVLVAVQPTGNANKRSLNISNEVHGQIIKAFGLKLAHEHLKSTVTSVTALPNIKTESASDLCCYSFNHAPKLAAVWSQVRSIETDVDADVANKCAAIQGIIYVWEDAWANDSADKKTDKKPSKPVFSPKQVLRGLLGSPFCADLYSSAMAPALLLAMQLGFEIDLTQSRIKVVVSDIEAKTGYHIFENRVAASAHARLGQLAMRASGSATKLASIDRKSTSMHKVLHFIIKQLDKEASAAAPSLRDAQHLLRHHVGVLEERLEMQMLDTQYTMKRVDIQINALFNMMMQQDNSNGIELAKSSHQIARASYRDSSSMKTLAIVTMFFLPGSFVSAMFSMPMFKWDKADPDSSSIGVGLLPQFGLYWVITLPLTIATFCLYLMWLWYLTRQRDREVVVVPLKSVDSSDGEEGQDAVEERRIERKTRPNDAVGQRSDSSKMFEARSIVSNV
ncbi:hypothetical protein MY1884_005047 [Beauveria asiatica]